MNTRPDAITVLCYGDSNTWGQTPDKSGRYPANVRWTGKLQDTLGSAYEVIEEGLNSRTTDLDYGPERPGRNGKPYLLPCLVSHNPLSYVVVMLGTNDLKLQFDRSAAHITGALGGLVEDIKTYGKDAAGQPPRIILVSPILVDETAARFAAFNAGYYDHDSVSKSQQLAGQIGELANQTGCLFVDAATVAHAGDDGIHFDEPSHGALGELLAKTILADQGAK